jgi:hypothetical protein
MEIMIHKIDSREVDGDSADIISTYAIVENGREFRITCRSNRYGRSFSLEGKDGTLYTSREDNMVHRQVVALGGGCGLLIDDEPVEGLSPIAIHGVILGQENKEVREINIKTEQSKDNANQLLLLIDGMVKDFNNYSDVFGDLASCP